MNLYLVRHSEALPIGGEIVRDANRPLSPRGEHDAARVGRFLAVAEPNAHQVICSPLVRARRSAEIIAAHLPSNPSISPMKSLEPGIIKRDLLAEIAARGNESLILVAHQPDLTELMTWLVSDGEMDVAFPAGATACVRFAANPAPGGARLQWIITPALLSLLRPDW
jgi:phosphohistidine phosphatase